MLVLQLNGTEFRQNLSELGELILQLKNEIKKDKKDRNKAIEKTAECRRKFIKLKEGIKGLFVFDPDQLDILDSDQVDI